MSVYRLDVAALFGVLDEARVAQGLSWRRLAVVVGSTPSAFTRMRHGNAPDAHLLVSLMLWLEWAPELQLLVRPTGGEPR